MLMSRRNLKMIMVKDGKTVTVSNDTQAEAFLKSGWVEKAKGKPASVDMTIPNDGWSVKQLRDYAEKNGIDLLKLTKKADILDRILDGEPDEEQEEEEYEQETE
jgi:hypothetical protein